MGRARNSMAAVAAVSPRRTATRGNLSAVPPAPVAVDDGDEAIYRIRTENVPYSEAR